MQFFKTPFTFDRMVRGAIFVAVIVALVFLFQYLSPVLVPFFVAWALAWVLVPLVNFFERRLHISNRSLCILAALVVVVLVFMGVVAAVVPIFWEGAVQLRSGVMDVVTGKATVQLPGWVQEYVDHYASSMHLKELLSQENVLTMLRAAAPGMRDVMASTVNVVMGLTSAFFALLYLVFILKDYDKFSTGWTDFVPKRQRTFVHDLSKDVGRAMRSYLRGQTLVALSNIVMFSIGFWIIGLKMWLPMGIFVGLISFVPYIQVAGFAPAMILALLEVSEGGRPFWVIMLLVAAVYIVVQIIQDAVVTPRVMGKIMGLSPAIVLLALMVWGYIGGLVGLIVALPLTTTLVAYYKKYVIDDGTETGDLFKPRQLADCQLPDALVSPDEDDSDL